MREIKNASISNIKRCHKEYDSLLSASFYNHIEKMNTNLQPILKFSTDYHVLPKTITVNEFVRQTATSSTSNSRVDHAQQLRSSAPNSSNGHLQKQKISTASNSYMSDHEQRYRGKYKTFVQLLYSILEADKYSDIISWLSNGDCWEIKNRQRFISEILPSVCVKSSQWKAFLRQLSGWGFKRG